MITVPTGSPPSSYAMADFVEGKPGGATRVAAGTAVRAGLIAPGLWLAGVEPTRIVKAAAFASAGVTFWLWLKYSAKARG